MNTQAQILREIAEEAERGGEYWKRFEVNHAIGNCDNWQTPKDPKYLLGAALSDFPVQRKPRTASITGPGGTYEYPEPLREAPEEGKTVYHVGICGSKFGSLPHPVYAWEGGRLDRLDLKRGLLHTTRQARDQHARALILAGGGQVEE